MFERSLFHLGIIVSFVAMQEFKVSLSVGLNICLDYKSRKHWSILMKFGIAFAVTLVWTTIWDLMLNSFYRDTSNSWTFVFIYNLLLISLCDNTNVIARTGYIMGFLVSKFGREILERKFEKSSKSFFSSIFLNIFFLQAISLGRKGMFGDL